MARALAAAGFEVVCWNRTPDSAIGARGRAGRPIRGDTRPTSRGPPTCASRCWPTGRRWSPSTAVRTACSPAPGPGTCWSTRRRCRRRRSANSRRRRGAPGRACSTRPCRAASAWPEPAPSRSWSAARRPTWSARRPVLSALATTVFHLGPLGTGAAMKLAVNTVVFGLNQAWPRRSCWPRRPASTGRVAYERARGEHGQVAVHRLQAGGLPRTGDRARSPSRSISRPRTCA